MLENMGKLARMASKELLLLDTRIKNKILEEVARELVNRKEEIKVANEIDIVEGEKAGITSALLDRLRLTDARIESIAQSLIDIAKFTDPIGEVISGWKHENGMTIDKKRVPLGVLGMIYESRPNVTIDAAGLALKSSNAIILRGSSNAINSNVCLNDIFIEVGEKHGLPKHAAQLIKTTDREAVKEMIRMNKYIDVIIPRGGKGLKQFVLDNSNIPVLETGAGICHVYVDESGNIDQAVKIIENGKVQRPSVCNAIETVLVNEKILDKLLPKLTDVLLENKVDLRYDQMALDVMGKREGVSLANDDDFGAEYLDLILSLKTVKDVNEAITYINDNGTHHSDCIITESLQNSEKFLNEVDSAVVYLNASTRFSDGSEFGYGGEIGISTQKLHARGPMGVRELTTTKYVIRGIGQVRG